jgi:hypothetical protein
MLRFFGRLDVIVALCTFALCVYVGNFWLPSFMHRATTIHRLLNTRRDLVMKVYIAHPSPGLLSESWSFHDLDGYSRIRYTVTGPRGEAMVTEPPSPRVDVPALFDSAKNFGLLHIPKGSGESHIFLAVLLGKVWEQRDIYFPTALMTQHARREYHVDLSKRSANSALSLIELRGTQAPGMPIVRYLAQVHAFGTPAFRAACQAARSQVESPTKR